MKYALIAVGALVLGMMVGCGPVDEGEALSSEGISLQDIAALPDGTQVSPELMAAVLAHVPQPTDELFHPAAACPSAKTCTNLGYGSCASWSAFTSCSFSTCNPTDFACRQCEYDPDLGHSVCEDYGGQNQTKYRYRACFNAAGQICTEYDLTSVKVCGCAL
jgi:hypothetical protein